MAGLITHQYILCRALHEYQNNPKGILTGLKESLKTALKHAKDKDGYKNYYTDVNCVSAGFAHIGAVGPDLFYLGVGTTSMDYMANLMHYNKTGPYVIFGINSIKEIFNDNNNTDKELNILAYYMGHASHIAADVIVHPLVNSLVGAYPDLSRRFFHARSKNISIIPLWRTHNIIEHYQDAYVLHYKYPEFNVNVEHWKNIMIGIAAANEYKKESYKNDGYYFILKNAKGYYKHKKNKGIISESMEIQKYNFFLDENKVMDSSTYFEQTIPDKVKIEVWKDVLVQESFFNKYIEKAVSLTKQMWDEILNYIVSGHVLKINEGTDVEKEIKFAAYSKTFPILRKHWNLDTGFGPYIGSKIIESFKPKKNVVSLDSKNAKKEELKEVADVRINCINLIYENYNKEKMHEAPYSEIEEIIKDKKENYDAARKKEEDDKRRAGRR